MSGKNDDDKLPEVARRRGNADTLFSADWFDEDDEDGDEAPKADSSPPAPADPPEISAPAMYQPPAPEVKPSAPPPAPPKAAAPPAPAPAAPPPPKRLSNPTILPDFDHDDDEDVEPPPPPVLAPKPSAPAKETEPEKAADAPDDLPDIAKRRGNADTLFSADWFGEEGEASGTPAPAETKAPASSAPISKAAAPVEEGSNKTLLMVGVFAAFLFLACMGVGTGIGIVLMLK